MKLNLFQIIQNSKNNKDIKLAEKRIKLGLILNEYGENYNIKVYRR